MSPVYERVWFTSTQFHGTAVLYHMAYLSACARPPQMCLKNSGQQVLRKLG